MTLVYCSMEFVSSILLNTHHRSDGDLKVLTKGDNNYGNDREGNIYAPGQSWIARDEVIGRARG